MSFKFPVIRLKQLVFLAAIAFLPLCQIPYHASDVFEAKADLNRDEAPHPKNSLEWWYFTGHFNDTAKQRKFGMEFVVFHFNPIKAKGGWMVNMAVSDPQNNKFYYDHKFFHKKKNQFHKLPLNFHWNKRGIKAKLQGEAGNYFIQAKMKEYPISFELSSKAKKPVVMHDEVGYEQYGDYAKAGYYSFPRMASRGKLSLKEESYQLQGELWYDRQWNCSGVFERKIAWDWFSVQFEETQSELMVYRLYHLKDEIELYGGTYTDRNGKSIDLKADEIKIKEIDYWKSPDSEAIYPIEWEISIPSLKLKSRIYALFPNQELELKFSPFTKFYYWEGMCRTEGSIDGGKVSGDSYVEMTNRFRVK